MYCAVLADIHSNLEALTRVFAELKVLKPERILIPGDVVGYGADPHECLKLVSEMSDEIILGNHDEAVANVGLRNSFSLEAKIAIEWTAGILSDEDKKFFQTCPRVVIDGASGFTMVHGTPLEAEAYHYLFSPSSAEIAFRHFETPVCFVGHTHIPALHSASGRAIHLEARRYKLERKERYIINPGSVGQPRDRNPQTSFALFDSEKFELEIVRLDYDNRKAAEKIRQAGLPRFLADRLL